MELVFDVVSAQPLTAGFTATMTFRKAGGIIGRAETCDWVIPDRKRVVSGRHALVTFENGAFHLTDTSSNGILVRDSGARLQKNEPHRIEHGSVYSLGEFEIRARLIQDPAVYESDLGRPEASGSIIPDDAFLDLDPLNALDQQESAYAQKSDLDLFDPPSPDHDIQQDYARIDMESLLVPEMVAAPTPPSQPEPATPPPRMPSRFWEKYSEALGVNMDDLGDDEREALALAAAKLLKQSIGGLQQSLKTRSDLKSEMRLALTAVQGADTNPLKHASETSEALTGMLRNPKLGQMSASRAVSLAFRDLQAHQVALISASRAVVKAVLDQLAPDQLALRFESENKSLLRTAGGNWRDYSRLHHSMQRDDEWSKRLFARDFAMAYEEQVRLIATLNTDIQG
ncbi:type VI secretion system-associated FHA domain protein TagH [Pseudomonas sp. OIL-1]|uniref:type VI secretion system-associated FHA domain protein TagH n=1 Tax=Pseudomonas sp. OIL-1 TaxID=2706126 RepID=UPI0013A72F8E|nr:type VI secretion system-associated FHA domain protein TagH [Pseudomonas sp. OIL-1]QIB51857.1 type VI secretion system-associated FHA domain protein TagH [Pseudomonas sp. OIL-1]